jgi:hypothetical protein
MAISMYQASVPVFIRGLTNLNGILGKAVAHAQSRKIQETVFFNARLYPDMFPLSRQVQIAADHAKGVARLAGLEPPPFEDNEQTFADLAARIDRTIAYLDSLTAAQIDGSEERVVSRKLGGKQMSFKGQVFLLQVALPNFFFHATTAYAILRHNGWSLARTSSAASSSPNLPAGNSGPSRAPVAAGISMPGTRCRETARISAVQGVDQSAQRPREQPGRGPRKCRTRRRQSLHCP